jgi:hypothetical protein
MSAVSAWDGLLCSPGEATLHVMWTPDSDRKLLCLTPAHLGGWEVVEGQRVDGCGESSPHGTRRGLCYQCGRQRPTSWSHSELVDGFASWRGTVPSHSSRARNAKPSRAQDAVTMLEG